MRSPKIKEKLSLTEQKPLFDGYLLFAIISLITIGFIMVTSSSIEVADNNYSSPFYFSIRQLSFIIVGLVLSGLVMCVSLDTYHSMARIILILAITCLLVVLVPGIGRTVNGSTRWIPLGFVAFQVSEFAKLAMILYLSRYLSNLGSGGIKSVRNYFSPLFLLGLISFLLLLEPDFGATVVIVITCLGMLFLANAPIKHFLFLFVASFAGLLTLAISAPYRLKRMTSFLNPWERQFDSGYQLTQALIAFGRGEWFGVGLGASIQKLFFLPESHTDFLFSVLAEELGLVGCVSVLFLFGLFFFRGMHLAEQAKKKKLIFASYVAYGITLWIGLQAVVSIGVNTGILPTKGLTLPFMSYGGSSIVLVMIACSILLRINFEVNTLKD